MVVRSDYSDQMDQCYRVCKNELFNRCFPHVFELGHEIFLYTVTNEEKGAAWVCERLVGGVEKFETINNELFDVNYDFRTFLEIFARTCLVDGSFIIAVENKCDFMIIVVSNAI